MNPASSSRGFGARIKATAAFAAFVFFLNTVAPVSYAQTMQGGTLPAAAAAPSSGWLGQFEIPESLGRVESVFTAPEASSQTPVVIHIQDAHTHAEAQLHIEGILEELQSRGLISGVFVEGAAGPLHPEILKVTGRDPVNLALADYLLNLGELTGVERFALKNNGRLPVLGAEDPSLYRESYVVFTRAKEFQEKTVPLLESYAQQLEKLQMSVLPKDVHEYVMRSSEWHRHQETSFRYFELLSRYSARFLGLNFSDARLQFEWPSFVRLMTLQNIEKDLNSEASARDLDSVLGALETYAAKRNGSDKERAVFLIQQMRGVFSSEGPQARISDDRYPGIKSIRDLMETFQRESLKAGVDLLAYPDFLRKAGVLVLREEVDARLLFSEIDRIEKRVEDAIAVTPQQKEVLSLTRDFRILEKLFALNVSREEFDSFVSGRDRFEPAAFQERVLSLSVPRETAVLEQISKEHLELAVRFYELARKRDQVLLDRTLESAGGKAVVLITGGFHSQGVTELLRERGVSHAVVAPKMTQPGDETLYDKVMLGRHVSETMTEPSAAALVKMMLLQLPQTYSSLNPGSEEEQSGLVFRGLRDAVLPALRAQGVSEQTIFEELSRWINQTGVFEGSVFSVAFDETAGQVVLAVLPEAAANVRSELRMAPETDTLAWIAQNLPEDANRQKVIDAITQLNEEVQKKYESAGGASMGKSRSEYLLSRAAEATSLLDGQIRDVSQIEALVQEALHNKKIHELSLAHRAAFVLGAYNEADFPVVHNALKNAFSAIRFEEHRYSEDLSAEEYARLARRFSEAVSRETVQENLIIRQALTEIVFNTPASARRALEKENLVNELMRELKEPGKGRIPKLVFLTDLHGSTKVGSFIALALGIDDYAGITSPAQLEQRLLEDWKKKNPTAAPKTVSEILAERQTLIVGGSDYVDRGPKPYWGFQFNKWLRDNGLLKFINGNHDLWKDWNVIGLHLRVHDTLREIAASGRTSSDDLAENLSLIRRFVTTVGWDPEKDRQKFEDTEAQITAIMRSLMTAMVQGNVTDAVLETIADQIIDSGNNANHSLEWWAREWGIHGGWFDTFLDQINEELVNKAVEDANRTITSTPNGVSRLLAILQDETVLPEEIRPYAALWREKLQAGKPMFDRVEASLFSKGDDVKALKAEIERIKKANAEIRSANEKLAAEKRFGEMTPQHKVPSAFELTAKAAQQEMARLRAAAEALNDLLPGLNLPVASAEVVTQQNYRTNPSVVETALWDWKNFRLLYTDVYDNIYVHGIIPVDTEKLDFKVSYTNPEGQTFRGVAAIERIQYEVRSFFEQYDTLPDTSEFRAELDQRLGAAFQVLNEWYSDVLGFLKPESIQGFLKSGGAKKYPFGQSSDFSPREFNGEQGTMHVGHVESAKLRKQKMSYWIGGMEGGLLHGDFEMSEGYSGLGAIVQWFSRDQEGKLRGFSRFGYRESVPYFNNQIKEKEKKLKEASAATEQARTEQKPENEIEPLAAVEAKLKKEIEDLKSRREALVASGERMEDITFHDDLMAPDAEKIRPFVEGGDLARYYIDRFLRENMEAYRALKEQASAERSMERASFYERRQREMSERLRAFRKEESNRLLDALLELDASAAQKIAAIRGDIRTENYAVASAKAKELSAAASLSDDFADMLAQTARALELFSRSELRGGAEKRSELALSDFAGSPAQTVGIFISQQGGTFVPGRSELRTLEGENELPAELQAFLQEKLELDYSALSDERRATLVKVQKLIEEMNQYRALSGDHLPELRELFRPEHLESPATLASALAENPMFQPSFKSTGVQDETPKPNDAQHGYVLGFVKPVLSAVPDSEIGIRSLLLEKVRGILKIDHTYHVVLKAISAMDAVGAPAVSDLVLYALPTVQQDYRRESTHALRKHRSVSEPFLIRKILGEKDDRFRRILADMLQNITKENNYTPEPRMSRDALGIFIGDKGMTDRIAGLLGVQLPTYRQFVNSSWFLHEAVQDREAILRSRLLVLQRFKSRFDAVQFSKLLEDWGFDSVSHWAEKKDIESERELFDFMIGLPRTDKSVPAMTEALRVSRSEKTSEHMRSLLLLLLEGKVFAGQGVGNLVGLIRENPRESAEIMAFLIVMMKLQSFDFGEDGEVQKNISRLLHSDIGPVYFLARKLAETIPHATSVGISVESGIRKPSADLDDSLNRSNKVFHYLRLEFHRSPSTADLELMRETLRTMLDLHHPNPQRRIRAEDADRVIRLRLSDLVKDEAQREVFADLKSPLVISAASFIAREIINRGGSENDTAEYLLDHFPEWTNFSDEEKKSEGYRAARLLIETFSALRARYVLNMGALNLMTAGDSLRKEEAGDIVGALETLQSQRADIKKLLLSDFEMEETWDIYIKRHIAEDDWGFSTFGSYGTYYEKKFDNFEKDRILERYSENLHDRYLSEQLPKKLSEVAEAIRAAGAAGLSPEAVLPEEVRRPLRDVLKALRVLVDQMAMEGMANERLVMLMSVLETEPLDMRQTANILSLMQDEAIRMYDFFNFHFADYPKQLALALGQQAVFARFRKDNDHELTDLQWAGRTQETLLADLNAEEKTISTFKRYLEGLQEMAAALKDRETLLLNPMPLGAGELPVSGASFDEKTVSPVRVGSKAFELLKLKAAGYPVPALSVLSSDLPRNTSLETNNPVFRFAVLRALLELEKESGRVFPFPMQAMTPEEREEIEKFRGGYAFNPEGSRLSLSIRSGSFYSMPGMMDTVLNMPFNETIREDLIRRGEPETFVLDNYRRFLSAYAISRYNMEARLFSEAVDEIKLEAARRLSKRAVDVTIAEFTAAELRKVISRFEEIILTRVPLFKLEDPFTQVLKVTVDVYNSWDSKGARRYRETFGISPRFGTAVLFQQMVYGNRNLDSGTAVVISSDPAMGKHFMSGAWKFGGQGTELVSGMTGDYFALTRHEGGDASLEVKSPVIFGEVRKIIERLDQERGPQDIEITVEKGKVYLLQTRPMVLSGKNQKIVLEPAAEIPFVRGVPVSPNAAVGRMVNARNLNIPKIKSLVTDLRRMMDEAGEQDLGIILVSDYVNDDTAAAILDINSELGTRGITGIINSKVGVSSHAGLIARRLGIAYVSDVETLVFDDTAAVTKLKGEDLKFGMAGKVVSIDGYSPLQSEHSGKVFLGKVPARAQNALPTLPESAQSPEIEEGVLQLNYDAVRKPLLTAQPVKVALNLGAYRVDREGRPTTVLESNFDLSRSKITNTVPNRVLDAFLRDLVGDPNFSLTDIYGVEDPEKFFAFLRGNIAHGVFSVDQLSWNKEPGFWVLTLNGHNIRVYETPISGKYLGSRADYVIDFSDPDLTRETREQRETRLKELPLEANVKRVFSFSGDEDPADSVFTAGINNAEFTEPSRSYVPLASPLTLAAAQVLSVMENAFPGEFDVYSSVLATRPLSGEAGSIAFIRDKQFGAALQGLFPQLAPQTSASPAAMFEFDIPKGAGNIRLFLIPKPGSRFEKIKDLGKDEKAAQIKVLQKEINKAVETAAKGAQAPFLRYAGEEHLSSLTGLRDTHAVVFDSQATAVVEGGKVELYFHMNDIGYASALNRTLQATLAADVPAASESDKQAFAVSLSRGIWPTSTIAPNKVQERPRFVAPGDEIGFGIIGVRGRIGKQVHQLVTSNPNYVPEFWIGVQDIDTLIQQFKEDVGQGPSDVTRDGEVYELEKGKDEFKDHVLLKHKATGERLMHPKTGRPLAIPYYNITMKPQQDPDAFERHLRDTLGDAMDRVETIFNAAGFGLDKNDPYYEAFLGGAKLKRIILTAPAKGAVDVTVVRGVNESALAKAVEGTEAGDVLFCSAASCTTNGLGRALIEFIGILDRAGFPQENTRFITHHAMTPSQGALFGAASAGKSQRTANDPRMSAMLEATGANKVVVEVWNSFKGKLSGVSHRDGNYAGSVLVVTAFIKAGDKPYPTTEQINAAFKEISERADLKGILSYKPGVLSTAQIAGDRTTSMFLPEFTKVESGQNGASVTVVVGYDNEAGYTDAVVRFDELLAMAARGLTPPDALRPVDAVNQPLMNKIYAQHYEGLVERVKDYLALTETGLFEADRQVFNSTMAELLRSLQENPTAAGADNVLLAAQTALDRVEKLGSVQNLVIRKVENDLENTISEMNDALNRSELRGLEDALSALDGLGLNPAADERAKILTVEDAARHADRAIRVNYRGFDLASLKVLADEWIRAGRTPYQGPDAIRDALGDLNSIRGIESGAFLNHLANLVADRIRSFDGQPRSELRLAGSETFDSWKADYQAALPFLGSRYEDRRWVAVHMTRGIFAVIPAALASVIRDAARRFVQRDLFYFDGNFDRPLNGISIPAEIQTVLNQPGLEISIAEKIENPDAHFLGVGELLSRKPNAYIYEVLVGASQEEALKLQRAFSEDPAYAAFSERYRVIAASKKDLSRKLQDAAASVYNRVRGASDASNLAEFIERHVAYSSTDRETLVSGLTHTGWLIHDDLGRHPGLVAARMDRSVALAAGQLEPELIRKLGEIKALRKVISAAGSLMSGLNLQLIEDLWNKEMAQRWFYKSA